MYLCSFNVEFDFVEVDILILSVLSITNISIINKNEIQHNVTADLFTSCLFTGLFVNKVVRELRCPFRVHLGLSAVRGSSSHSSAHYGQLLLSLSMGFWKGSGSDRSSHSVRPPPPPPEEDKQRGEKGKRTVRVVGGEKARGKELAGERGRGR